MNCSTICLLTSYINFMRGPDTVSCGYCVDSRSTYGDCYDNVLECAYRDPASLFICLNIYENSGDLVHHVGRCVSYEQFYINDADISTLSNGGMCKYNSVQHCECEQCPTPTTTVPPSTSTTTMAPTTHRKKNHKHHGSHKYDHHHPDHQHPLTFHNGSIGAASAYRESQLAAASSSYFLPTIFPLLLIKTFLF